MRTARLIVCEKTGTWATALRRELAKRSIRVYQTRSLAECFGDLAVFPASFLVLELRESIVEEMIEHLGRLSREYAGARAVILARRGMEPYEWLLREAGAAHVVFSPRRLAPVADMAQRHLAVAPEAPLPLPERILAELPWTD